MVIYAYIFHRKRPVFFGIYGFCFAWALLWEAMAKGSLYMVAIQSVLRTFKIYHRALNISITILIGTVAINFLMIITPFVIGGVIFDHKNQTKVGYIESLASCGGGYSEPPFTAAVAQTLLVLLPMPVIVISCILCVYKLFQRNGVAINNIRKRSIISLLVFSLTCLFLNIPYCLILLQRLLQHVSKSGGLEGAVQSAMTLTAWPESTWMLWYGYGLIRRVSVSLNSVLNPFIYYWRMSEFRTFISATLSPTCSVDQRVRELGYFLVILMRRLFGSSDLAIQNQGNSRTRRERPNVTQPAMREADGSFPFVRGNRLSSSSGEILRGATRYVTSNCGMMTGKIELETLVSENRPDDESEDKAHEDSEDIAAEDSGASSQCQCECCFLHMYNSTLLHNDRVRDTLLFSNLAACHREIVQL